MSSSSSSPISKDVASGSDLNTNGDTVIIARGVSKRYELGEREQYGAFRDVLASGFRRTKKPKREELWALSDISFSVGEGEVVGIIGRNGAGKSTLLKLLSRITIPTAGEIKMRGRIGSLLEVGSGFHPELTGLENVYLNGAILGMKRSEIRSKVDAIVAFAEMEKFIDTPVKHYSVGMFMRLAFAVAAHLDTEILVVDEVLAVGDARFQSKCLAKMGEVARSGRSILFVSHNLEATVALCDRGLLLEAGRLSFDGSTRQAVDTYRQLAGVTTRSGDQLDLSDSARQEKTQPVGSAASARFVAVTVRSGGDQGSVEDAAVRSGGRLQLDVVIEATSDISVSSLGLTLGTEGGLLLLNVDSADAEGGPQELQLRQGSNNVSMIIPRLLVAPGRYRVGLRMANPVTTRIGSGAIDFLDPAFVIQVDSADDFGVGNYVEREEGCRISQGAGSLVQGSLMIC